MGKIEQPITKKTMDEFQGDQALVDRLVSLSKLIKDKLLKKDEEEQIVFNPGDGFYDYEDKPNKEEMIKKRRDYIVKAIDELREQDSELFNLVLKYIDNPEKENFLEQVLEKIRNIIVSILSEDQQLNKKSSSESFDELAKEYNKDIIDLTILEELGEKNI